MYTLPTLNVEIIKRALNIIAENTLSYFVYVTSLNSRQWNSKGKIMNIFRNEPRKYGFHGYIYRKI